ncbi:MAG: PDR/VanB family oxidoreductase [Proteobacteria bacterium]|nr:PDR/VanB family oxidoreductase [Pseudomonadota bacterium]
MVAKQKILISAMRYEAKGILSIEMVSAQGDDLAPFTAGSHIDVFLHDGLVRQYSLMSDPKVRNRYQIAVLLEDQSRGGSAFVHQSLRVGDVLEVSHPRNNFEIVEDATSHVFVAGGIGITPFISMAHHCIQNAIPVKLYYCARAPETTAFVDHLTRLFGKNMLLHYDGGDPSKSIDLTKLVASESNAQLYCCGPRGLMTALAEAVEQRGGSLITEHFNPVGSKSNDEAPQRGCFTVELSRSGVSIDVAEGQTIIEALKTANVDVETSCEAGVCGTCVVDYLEGEPIHNDVVLMPDEQKNSLALCVAGCKSKKLVLDL